MQRVGCSLRRCAKSSIACIALCAASVAPSDGEINRRTRIVPDDGRPHEQFGYDCAVQNDELFIGSINHSRGVGAVYVYRRVGTQWVQQQLLEASVPFNLFGAVLAVDGDLLVVGAPGDWDAFATPGAAHVLRRTASGWIEEARLTAPDATPGDGFGWSVAVHDGRVVIGGRREAVFLFGHDGAAWVLEQQIEASDGTPGDLFGFVTIHGDRIVVGAPNRNGVGAAYVFDGSPSGWIEGQILEAGDGSPEDDFGSELELQNETLVIAAPGVDGAAERLGSVHVFRNEAGYWIEEIELHPRDVQDYMDFGTSLSLDGDRLVSGTNGGFAYVFRRDTSGWIEDARLDAGEYPYGTRWLGWATAADGGVIVVGATGDDENGPSAGAAYVFDSSEGEPARAETKLRTGSEGDRLGFPIFMDGSDIIVGANRAGAGGAVLVLRRDGARHVVAQELSPSDAEALDYFGTSISISGDVMAIGANGDDDAGPDSGAVYLFRRNAGRWEERGKLTAPDAVAGENFGMGVVLEGGTLGVSAPWDDDQGTRSGSVYVFRGGDTIWNLESKLVPAEVGSGDYFGLALALRGDTLVASAPFDGIWDVYGSVYTYQRTGSQWNPTGRLRPNTSAGANFGWALSMDDDELVVGSPVDHGNGYLDGAAYVYRRSGATWSLEGEISAGLASPLDGFGYSVRLVGDTILVGAYYDDDAILDSGSVYLFRREGDEWVERQRVAASDPMSGSLYGYAVDTDESNIVVGAPLDDDGGPASGSIYLYEEAHPPSADAGMDTQVECASQDGGIVTLDGSGSTDPDSTTGNDDIVAFEWFRDFGSAASALIATGELAEVTLPLGAHTITLRVTDRTGLTDTDEVLETVVDTTPPTVSVVMDPESLWPPNHRLVEVGATVSGGDLCGGATTVLTSIVSSEADNAPASSDGDTSDDIQGADFGSPDYAFSLRAERDGAGGGRTYAVSYAATDGAGNTASATTEVVVPHDRNGETEPLMITVTRLPDGTSVTWTPVEGASHHRVIRRRLSQVRENDSAIQLGEGRCVESGATDTIAVALDEHDMPAAGEVLLYVVEYVVDHGPSGFGTESAAKPRETAASCH